MKTVAVLMTCFNRREKTLCCLHNLFAQEGIPCVALSVFLVDDASTDGTSEAVRKLFPNVHIVPGTGDLYWCRGMYKAWETAGDGFDYYLWLNDDTFISKRCLNTLLSISANEPQSIISGCIADHVGGSVVYGGNVESLNGNVVLIPQSVYRLLGPLDGHYHQRYGDHDYGHRAHSFGVKIIPTDTVVGVCAFNPGPKGKTRTWSLMRRWKSLFRPTEFHLGDAFYYRKKHKGMLRGLISVAHIVFIVMTGKA